MNIYIQSLSLDYQLWKVQPDLHLPPDASLTIDKLQNQGSFNINNTHFLTSQIKTQTTINLWSKVT